MTDRYEREIEQTTVLQRPPLELLQPKKPLHLAMTALMQTNRTFSALHSEMATNFGQLVVQRVLRSGNGWSRSRVLGQAGLPKETSQELKTGG